jgi:4a-hydroxytetrahydrobiopterin dehydratase
MPDPLGADEIDAALAQREIRWERQGDVLVKVVRRSDFVGSLEYVTAVGALAEAANHHPDIDIRWDTVTLRLTTHSVNALTELDLSLAAQIDGLDA